MYVYKTNVGFKNGDAEMIRRHTSNTKIITNRHIEDNGNDLLTSAASTVGSKMSSSMMDDVFELLALAKELENDSRLEAATKVRGSWWHTIARLDPGYLVDSPPCLTFVLFIWSAPLLLTTVL